MKKPKIKKWLLMISAGMVMQFGLTQSARADCTAQMDSLGGGYVTGYAYNTGGAIAGQAMLECFYKDTMDWMEKIYNKLDDIYQYVSTGKGDSGTGIIGEMNKNFKQQRMQEEELMANNTQHAQRIGVEGQLARKIADAMPDPRDCYDIPRRMSTRAGGGGGGTAAAKGSFENRMNIESVKASELDHAVAASNRSGKGYCAIEDAELKGAPRGAFGCTAAMVNRMPNGDARVQSLFVPAHDYANTGSAKAVSLTFNNGKTSPAAVGDQRVAAQDALINITSRFSPPALDQRAEQSAQGKVFLSKWKVYEARVSGAQNALAAIAARRDSQESELPRATAVQLWADAAATYGRVFGSATPVPELPSEAELMRFEVLRRYADKGDGGWDVQMAAAPDKAPIEMVRTLAVTNYLLLQIHQRLEEGNAVAATAALNQLNPMNKADVEKAAAAAVGATK